MSVQYRDSRYFGSKCDGPNCTMVGGEVPSAGPEERRTIDWLKLYPDWLRGSSLDFCRMTCLENWIAAYRDDSPAPPAPPMQPNPVPTQPLPPPVTSSASALVVSVNEPVNAAT